MRIQFVTILLAGCVVGLVAGLGNARAADGCGVGCHATVSGACVVDGLGDRSRQKRMSGRREAAPAMPGRLLLRLAQAPSGLLPELAPRLNSKT